MLGILNDIEIDNSICIITLDNTDNDKQSICKAETRMFLNAIDDCFGDNWRGQLIEYDLDSIGCMIAFQPAVTVLDDAS